MVAGGSVTLNTKKYCLGKQKIRPGWDFLRKGQEKGGQCFKMRCCLTLYCVKYEYKKILETQVFRSSKGYPERRQKHEKKAKRLTVMLLALAMVLAMVPAVSGPVYASDDVTLPQGEVQASILEAGHNYWVPER